MNIDIKDPVGKVLLELYTDWKENEPKIRSKISVERKNFKDPREEYALRKDFYMPINRECGNLLYGLIKANKPKSIVEFGTSFGISTLFMAAAVKENKQGKIFTTEYFIEKIEKAKNSFQKADVQSFVNCLIGDAIDNVKELPETIDFVFLDGAKSLYYDFLLKIKPKLAKNAILIADNTNAEDLRNYLDFVRDSSNGFISTSIRTNRDGGIGHHEISFYIKDQ